MWRTIPSSKSNSHKWSDPRLSITCITCTKWKERRGSQFSPCGPPSSPGQCVVGSWDVVSFSRNAHQWNPATQGRQQPPRGNKPKGPKYRVGERRKKQQQPKYIRWSSCKEVLHSRDILKLQPTHMSSYTNTQVSIIGPSLGGRSKQTQDFELGATTTTTTAGFTLFQH